MIDANDLRHALTARGFEQQRLRKLTDQLQDMEQRDLAACDALADAAKALEKVGALLQLDEAKPDDLAAARAKHAEAWETSRGTEEAVKILKQRIAAQEATVQAAERNIAAVAANLAAPLIDGVRSEVEHHARGLGASLKLLHQLHDLVSGGFLTGEAAERFAGSPGWLLGEKCIRADGGMLLPVMRERSHSLKPQELLALIEEQ